MSAVLRLRPDDALRYVYFRQRMLADDWELTSRHGLEAFHPANAVALFADERSATFAVEDDDRELLLAAATITRNAYPRYAHRARILNVFTEPRHRGKGHGAAVVAAAIDHARTWPGVDFVDLCVRGDAVPAQRLYARLGFVEWGRQAEAADGDGRRIDEIHMTLRLAGRMAPE